MRIPRIFTPQDLTCNQLIELEQQASIHLSRVLRLQAGHPLTLFNGQGGEYQAEIAGSDKKQVTVKILAHLEENKASPLQTEICVGVSKGDKMDLIVQKCTELGVNRIIPVITERSDVKLNQDRWAKKQSHWQQVAISACEQSGRNQIPTLAPVQKFADWLKNREYPRAFMLHPGGSMNIQQALSDSPAEVSFCFGSEGGFSEQEALAAQAQGVELIGLGPRVLRAETAPIAVLGIAQTLCGDF